MTATPLEARRAAPPAPHLSIVVPCHDEESHVEALYRRLVPVLDPAHAPFEILFVDDGSRDRTREVIRHVSAADPRVRLIPLKRNYGQTAALAAGFDHARGEIVVAMDGDLQHDPADIPALLAKLEEGYDLVSGWRAARVDNLVMRRIPSRCANWLMAKLSGVALHDFGTTFKAYRRTTLSQMRLYGEMHRFIPAVASWNGARIAEVPISNINRERGASHYGISRVLRVMFDLLTIRFLLRYVTRPMHFFGVPGLLGTLTGGLLGLFLLVRKLCGIHVFDEHGPLLVLAVTSFLAGLQFLSIGLVAELLTRTYFEGTDRRIYTLDDAAPQPGEPAC